MSDIDKFEKPTHPGSGPQVPQDPTGASVPPGAPGPRPSGDVPSSSAGGPSTSAPSQQELAVRSALESVMDPEIGLSVIDLGLIREIHFLPDKTFVRMMLTTPFCPYAPQLIEEVKVATTGVVPLDCEVELMPDAWSPELMPDPGLLGFSF